MAGYGPELVRAMNNLHAERAWFIEHGGTLEAYIDRYGIPGTDHCYGDGGRAIYQADLLKLRTAEYRVKVLIAKSLDKIMGKTK